jgi:hypothetical protein
MVRGVPMPVYKVSYVVRGSDHPGTISNSDHRPEIGEQIRLGEEAFEVVEVIELLPPRGDFHFIHVTCQPVKN